MINVNKILIAPDSFKESLSAIQVCDAIEKGMQKVNDNLIFEKLPLADGGEGTVKAMVAADNGELVSIDVYGPLGKTVTAEYGLIDTGKTAVIEMAEASGLALVATSQRNPLKTTTYGTGQLIVDALERGCNKIILGIGGSATTDFGTGLAQALGVRFFTESGKQITDFMNGELMGRIDSVSLDDVHPLLRGCEILVACDVDNPLLGPKGAVYTYSPQKGASPEICDTLEKNMQHIHDKLAQNTRPVKDIPGAGAAGGLGGGLLAFFNAQLLPGVQIVLDTCHFDKRIKDCDLIVTGEGKIDSQTVFGKTIAGVCERAGKQGVPVVALAGSVDISLNEMNKIGLHACLSICPGPMDLDRAMKNSFSLVEQTASQLLRLVTL